MKTFYTTPLCKIFLTLFFCTLVQLAKAGIPAVSIQTDTTKSAKNVAVAKQDKDKPGPEDGIDEDILARERQEFKRLKDPALNRVPVERLVVARNIKDQMMIRQANRVMPLNSKPGNLATISGIQWNERGPTNVGGRTRALMFDLNNAAFGYKKVFAGGVGGGLWYTNDITAATVQWNKINDFFENIAIGCIVQNPTNHNEIYVGTGEGWYNADSIQGLGVWKSSDGGITWLQLASTTQFRFINSILVDKNGSVYLADQYSGVQKSSNGGNSWNQVISSPNSGADLQLAANGDIYASTGTYGATGNIFISDFAANGSQTGNAGTWTNITPNTGGVITPTTNSWWRIKLACAPSNSDITYALFEGSNALGLTSLQQYNKTLNKWAVKTVPPGSSFSNGQAWYSLAAAVDPHYPSILYAGSLDAVRSIDGGSTWTPITEWYVGEISGMLSTQYVHADHHAYVFPPGSSTRMIMGTDGGVFYSANVNATGATKPAFAMKDNNYDVTQFYSVALHPTNYNYALAGAQDNGTQKFTNTGLSGTTTATGGDGAFAFIDQLNGNVQITSYVYDNYFVSTNNGATFTPLTSDSRGSFINPADYDNVHKNLYSGGQAGYYYRIANITSPSYAEVFVSGFASSDITSVTVAPITANRVYFGLNNGSVVRVDNANTGTSRPSVVLNPGVFGSVSSVTVDPKSENHILVSYYNYGVAHIVETKNANAATPVWTVDQGNLPDMPVRWTMFYPGDSTRAVIATELGVWTTDALNGASTTWNASNSGLANVRTDMLKYRTTDRTLAAATHGRGLFTTTLPFTSDLATLTNLTVSAGTLSPAFVSTTTAYSSPETYATTSVTVTPTANYSSAVITINGATVSSGTASAPITLNGGANTITVKVTGTDGSSISYVLTLTRPSSANDNLAYLVFSKGGAVSPTFSPTTTSYTLNEINFTSSVTVTPKTSDPTATVKVNGTIVASGTASAPINLNVGPNTISAVVTAQNGIATKTYTVTVTRAPSSNTNLGYLVLSKGGPVSPAFAPGTTSYTASVANTITSITVTAKTADPAATITINGTAVASTVASAPIALNVGSNIITTVVTAQDGVTTKAYTVTVTRAGPVITPDLVNDLQATPLFADDGVVVHQGVSPNGDGVNDVLRIDGITVYPENRLMIMDRNGRLVFEARGYDNSLKAFDGRSSKTGKMQQPGTYYFSLDYTVKGVKRHKTGYIVLKY